MEPARARVPRVDAHSAALIRFLIARHATASYRLLWARLCREHGVVVTKKTVYRTLKLKSWPVHQRQKTPRPRARELASRAARTNERWAMDVTRIPCGFDGGARLAAVIDCHDREIVGFEFALRGRPRRPNGPSRRRASIASARSVPLALHRPFVATVG